MNPIKKFTNVRNFAATRAARSLLLLGSVGVVGMPALAANVANSAQNKQTQTTQAQGNQTQAKNQAGQAGMQQRGAAQAMNLEVSYYSGDPLKGGALLSTVKLTPPQDQAGAARTRSAGNTQGAGKAAQNASTQRPVNPIVAQAPAGAKYAVIQDDHGGARIIDLSQADQMRGGGFGPRGGPQGKNGQGGQNTPARR